MSAVTPARWNVSRRRSRRSLRLLSSSPKFTKGVDPGVLDVPRSDDEADDAAQAAAGVRAAECGSQLVRCFEAILERNGNGARSSPSAASRQRRLALATP